MLHYYVDEVELVIRPIVIVWVDQASVCFDFYTKNGLQKGGITPKEYVFDSIAKAKLHWSQLIDNLIEQGVI